MSMKGLEIPSNKEKSTEVEKTKGEPILLNDEDILNLIISTKSKLMNFAKKLNSSSSLKERAITIDDLYQTTLQKVIEKIKKDGFTIQGKNIESSFLTFSSTVMRNFFITEVVRHVNNTFSLEDVPINPVQVTTDVVSDVEFNDFKEKFHHILGQISAEKPESAIYCEALKMFINGYKYEEIAEIYKIPVDTLKSGIFRLRENLKDIFYKMNDKDFSQELANLSPKIKKSFNFKEQN